MTTAAEKLVILGQPALYDLVRAHMAIRAVREDIEHVELTKLAHDLLQLASDAERKEMSK